MVNTKSSQRELYGIAATEVLIAASSTVSRTKGKQTRKEYRNLSESFSTNWIQISKERYGCCRSAQPVVEKQLANGQALQLDYRSASCWMEEITAEEWRLQPNREAAEVSMSPSIICTHTNVVAITADWKKENLFLFWSCRTAPVHFIIKTTLCQLGRRSVYRAQLQYPKHSEEEYISD